MGKISLVISGQQLHFKTDMPLGKITLSFLAKDLVLYPKDMAATGRRIPMDLHGQSDICVEDKLAADIISGFYHASHDLNIEFVPGPLGDCYIGHIK